MKCKVIGGQRPKEIEKKVNEWLSANPNVQIRFIAQGGAGNDNALRIVTSILYE
jgi:hypothetical protein